MNEVLQIGWFVVVFASGIALGGLFFGGLWLTVQYVPKTAGGGLLVLVSFVARTALVLLGMFYLTGRDWRAILVCVAGFLVARGVILSKVFGGIKDHETTRGAVDR
jgi:F1F0 ATPase subunit 2